MEIIVERKIMYVFLLLLFSIIPRDEVSRDCVDLIELNHFYDENGRLIFDQVIFYDWKDNVKVYSTIDISEVEDLTTCTSSDIKVENLISRYQVRAWRLVKSPSQIPTINWSDKVYKYHALWIDGEQIRYIKSKSIRETWTQYDPELVEREFLPKEKRKELRTVEGKKKKIDPPAGAIRPQLEGVNL